ncbi:MAG: AAA family ATPase, partial [Hydrogenophaga sp.]|uniref:AAA family ATPase n=1 Tax=Hydrogenophaga sp. TaxID=1904254 RepID=UPI0025BED969
PAGRSFFTSIGKAIAAFEQGRVLDPLILQFGRLYTAYREQGFAHYYGEKTAESSLRKTLERQFDELLGGRVERDGEREYLITQDDRKVPLSAMSSGQQELLPLATILPWLMRIREERICYIEEPEAHLFPKAQSQLIETLVSSVSANTNANLVLTTHSPYVLTKINNLLQAGALSRRLSEDKKKALDSIVSRRAWLTARNVSAYALRDGKTESILESDGLISADYLDEVSSEMSTEFGRLLELEESLD